jgi:hypothetical protein
MLWMKYWLETRYRFFMVFTPFLLMIGMGFLQVGHVRPNTQIPAEQRLSVILAIFTLFWIVPGAMLASSGIKTQPPLTATKGLHGSVHFTLSLPVSRIRLLRSRAGLGILEMAIVILLAVIGFGFLLPLQFPELRLPATDFARYGVTVFAFTLAVYSLSTLLATFMDDLWQMWGTMIAVGAARGLTALVKPPQSMDVFQALGANSPLLTHSFPVWPVVLSLAVAACLCSAAARSVRERDY